MKKNIGWLMLMLVLSFSEGWAGEKPYDFRKRLEVVHQADRRDPAAKCAADEYEIADGFRIGIAADAGDFVYRVARDFEDYLAVSMKVCASVVRGTGDLTLALDGVDGFRIEDVVLKESTSPSRVRVRRPRARRSKHRFPTSSTPIRRRTSSGRTSSPPTVSTSTVRTTCGSRTSDSIWPTIRRMCVRN